MHQGLGIRMGLGNRTPLENVLRYPVQLNETKPSQFLHYVS